MFGANSWLLPSARDLQIAIENGLLQGVYATMNKLVNEVWIADHKKPVFDLTKARSSEIENDQELPFFCMKF